MDDTRDLRSNTVTVQQAEVGLVLVASDPILIPANASWCDLIVDRDNMLDGVQEASLHVSFEISLDGGKTWGGTQQESTSLKQFSLLIGCGVSGLETPRDILLPRNCIRGSELSRPGDANRLIRAWYKPMKGGIAPGLSFRFTDPPVVDQPLPDHHSVAENAASAAQTYNGSAGPITWSHTASNTNPCAIVGAGWITFPDAANTASVTYDSVSMTSVGTPASRTDMEGSLHGFAQLFALAGITTGSAKTVALSWSSTNNYGATGSVSYDGVDQTTPTDGVQTATSTTVSVSATVTGTASSSMGAAVCIADSANAGLTVGDTSRWNGTGGGGQAAAQSDIAGASSMVLDFSSAGLASKPKAMQACNIRAAGAAASIVGSYYYRQVAGRG